MECIELLENIEVVGNTLGYKPVFYSITVGCPRNLIRIYASCSISAYLSLCISQHDQKPIKRCCSMSIACLTLDPEDFTTGTYVISLKLSSPASASHAISYCCIPPPNLIRLSGTFNFNLITEQHFEYLLQQLHTARLEIIITPLFPLQIFASSEEKFPHERWYEYCVGIFTTEIVTDAEEYTPDIETYIKYDILDRKIPRNFTRWGVAGEKAERNVKMLRFCVDSSELKNNLVRFQLRNKYGLPQMVKIEINEYTEADLLPSDVGKNKAIFEEIFSGVEGEQISRSAIKDGNLGARQEFTYGEVEYLTVVGMLEASNAKPGEIFWDLGCGVGKCLISAHLSCPGLIVKGVEFIQELYEICKENIGKLPPTYPEIELFKGDLLETDFLNADIIYCTNICFPDSLNEHLQQKLTHLKPQSRVILLKPLIIQGFKVLSNTRVPMSWGNAQLYILIKHP